MDPIDSLPAPKIQILFEDDCILAVMKPAGIKVHGVNGLQGENTTADCGEPTLETLVAEIMGRPLILLHRLDRDTTGIVLLAKRKDAAGVMSRAFEEKRIRKTYWAVVQGQWPKRLSRIESFIGRDASDPRKQRSETLEFANSRKAVTTFRVLKQNSEKTWLEVLPKTGRTHQIRVHCAGAGYPILGDRLYGQALEGKTMALHAARLAFRHPKSDAEMVIEAPPPEVWSGDWLKELKG